MWRAFGILLAAGMAGFAAADVQIFFTEDVNPWQGAGPDNLFAPTAGTQTDYTVDHYRPNFANFPTEFRANQFVTPFDIAYIWIKFNTDPQSGPAAGAKLNGLHLQLHYHSAPENLVWFVMDDTSGDAGAKRWDGAYTPPVYPEFKRENQVLVAVTADGIHNTDHDQPIGLYDGATHVALLGAIRITYDRYWLTLGDLGIHFNAGPSSPPVQFGTLTEVPEPAGVMVVALAVFVLRRR